MLLGPCPCSPRAGPCEGGGARDPRQDDGALEHVYEPWLFLRMLDELASTELGIGFVYSVLDVLAERYELLDAMIVLHDDALGTQAFRLGAPPGGRARASRTVEGAPGVYAEP